MSDRTILLDSAHFRTDKVICFLLGHEWHEYTFHNYKRWCRRCGRREQIRYDIIASIDHKK